MNTRNNSLPIAIIGMAFRFPGDVHDESSMWHMLEDGMHGISRIPEERWPVEELQHARRTEPGRSVSFAAGVLSHVDQFDAGFFGISPRETSWIDPQQRLLLEMSYEAMEDAGMASSSLAGSRCGVYVGISGMDYGQHALEDLASMTAYSMTGNTLSIAANRISYVFDLHGPSMAVDTACSSSLVALHQACQALRHGEIPMALVGGINLLMHPYSFIGFSHASMLSASGRCRPFDAAADGYVRAEGGAVLLLKPLRQAQKDGDNIHAVILATGVNTDGARKSGLTIPSMEAQEELMREVLERSGLKAADIDFIEAHGTGTPVGDPIEAASIGHVYGMRRKDAMPISSVKANFGHLETASGMAGLIKAILSLKKAALPPMPLDFTPNPNIDFQNLNVACAASGMPLRKRKKHAAGVNSFGFGGENAHVILQTAYPASKDTVKNTSEMPPLLLSARSDQALRELAGAYARHLAETGVPYYDVAYTAAFHRNRLEKRLILSADTPEATASALRSFAERQHTPSIITESAPSPQGGIVFVYTGNGSHWEGMGRKLYAESAIFRALMDDIERQLRPLTEFSLVQALLSEAKTSLEDTAVCQPLLFAIQLGITRILQARGITPQAVVGHSVGEVAAAWAAGALSLKQAAQVIHARSFAQGKTRGSGGMAAAGISATSAKELIAQLHLEEELEIAIINSPGNVILSGSSKALATFEEQTRQQGIFFRRLDLDYAFHSRHMDAIQDCLAQNLVNLGPCANTKIPFVSTVSGEIVEGSALDSHYWWKNLRQTGNFASAIQKLVSLGFRIFVEIGPHAILQRYIRENLSADGARGRVLSSLSRGDDGMNRLAHLANRLHSLGDHTDLRALFPHEGHRVPLPHYPWQKQTFWYPRTSECRPAPRRVHPLLGWTTDAANPSWENILDPAKDLWLNDHKAGGALVFPGAGYVEMVLAAARQWLGNNAVALESLDILTPLVFENGHAQCLRCSLNTEDGNVRIISRPRLETGDWTQHIRARILSATERPTVAKLEALPATFQEMDGPSLYALTSRLGLDYGPSFRVISHVRMAENRLEASLIPEQEKTRNVVLPPAVLDACFHSLASLYAAQNTAESAAFLPTGTGKIIVYSTEQVCRIRGILHRCGRRSLSADFELLDASGSLVAKAQNCRFRSVPLAHGKDKRVDAWMVRPWLAPLPESSPANIPSLEKLAKVAEEALSSGRPQREVWFKKILPLMEAMVLSAAARELKETPLRKESSSPYTRWLYELLRDEGLLTSSLEAEGKALSHEHELPPFEVLWREAFHLAPQCLPALLPLGRVCLSLHGLVQGKLDGSAVLEDVRNAVIARESRRMDPATQGTDMAIGGIMRHIAKRWPKHKKLRLLEMSHDPGSLTELLESHLPKDRFVHTLVLPDKETLALARTRYKEHPSVLLAPADISQWEFEEQSFDVVLFRHTLHTVSDYTVLLERVHGLLAPGGLLLIAERHADWCADFVEGLDPSWWREEASANRPLSPLFGPETWQYLLKKHGIASSLIFREPAAGNLDEGAFLLLASEPAEKPAAIGTEPAAASWLFLADEASATLADELCHRLAEHGQHARRTSGADTVSATQADHVVFMLGHEDSPATLADTLERLRLCANGCITWETKTPKLWIVTRGGALSSTLPDRQNTNPSQCAVAGFGRVIMQEYGPLHCALVDIPTEKNCPNIAARLEREFLSPDGTDEILLSNQARYALKVDSDTRKNSQPTNEQRCRLDFTVPGRLSHLQWQPDAARPLADDEIEARVMAAGLNFRDVMLTMGLLTDEAVEHGFAGNNLGLEFSGILTRVGKEVHNLHIGDRVTGFASGCLASHVHTPAHAVRRIPAGWNFERAAAVPTVFFTSWYALKHLANLQPGESVLIHSAAGGVGIAAIQIARLLGAQIFATAGSGEKRDFLRLLGVEHIFDSRSLSFAEDILTATDGKGVDVVLNSLAGESLRQSVSLLTPCGRFLELGKRDFVENTGVGLRPFKENISYFAIDVDQLLTARPKIASQLFQEVIDLLERGTLSPLPYRSFPAEQAISAFRTLQQAQHMGKIIINLEKLPILPAAPSAPDTLNGDGTWLVTGGLGGFGLATARHLARRGIKNLVLVGRHVAATPESEPILREFEEQGVNVCKEACDVTNIAAVRSLIKRVTKTMPHLQGIIHAAAVFDDGLLTNLDRESIEKVVSPKLTGAWNLHTATLGLPLTHFVLYSSISVTIGNPGQGNYVAGNAGLEGLTRLRLAMGLPALCIAWGPVGDAGYLARHEKVKSSLAQRLGKAPLSTLEAMRELDGVLSENGLHILANIDWQSAASMLLGNSRFSLVTRNGGRKEQQDSPENLQLLLTGRSPAEVRDIIRQLIVKEVAHVLDLAADQVSADRGLQSMGLDSLMAVELAVGLEQRTGVRLPAMLLQDSPTVDQLAERLAGRLSGHADEESAEEAVLAGLALRHAEKIKEEEAVHIVQSVNSGRKRA